MDVVVVVDGLDPLDGRVAFGENDWVGHLVVALALDDPVGALVVDDEHVGDVRACAGGRPVGDVSGTVWLTRAQAARTDATVLWQQLGESELGAGRVERAVP